MGVPASRNMICKRWAVHLDVVSIWDVLTLCVIQRHDVWWGNQGIESGGQIPYHIKS